MLLRLTSLVLFFLSLINYSLWRDERSARKLLEEELINTQPEARASLRPESITPAQEPESAPSEQPSPPLPTDPLPLTNSSEQISEAPATKPEKLTEMAYYGIESRVAAIGKFVTLTDEQRERLREKYTRDALAKRNGLLEGGEPLESIIGEQNAQFYKQQVASAFQRSQEQETDREIFYLSRKLSFTASQEARLRELLQQVEEEARTRFSTEKSSPEYTQDPSYRVRLMMQENQFKSDWLAEQLKSTLTSDQYQAYVQEQADSSSAELGIWHAP